LRVLVVDDEALIRWSMGFEADGSQIKMRDKAQQ